MRISDWSSDVCSSDLEAGAPDLVRRLCQIWRRRHGLARDLVRSVTEPALNRHRPRLALESEIPQRGQGRDRKTLAEGKSGAVRSGRGGRRNIVKNKNSTNITAITTKLISKQQY